MRQGAASMRVQEEIVRAGYFWLPASADRKLPGTLVIRDGGEPELEVVGNFDADHASYNESWAIGRVVGDIEKEGRVTLEGCQYRLKSLWLNSISKSVLVASTAIVGASFGEEEPLEFNSFEFGIEGLEEWIGISGIEVSTPTVGTSASITYSPPENMRIRLNDGLSMEICFTASLGRSSVVEGARITERIYLKLESEKLLQLSTFTALALKMVNFICFAVDSTLTVKDVVVYSKNICYEVTDAETRMVPLKLYYHSIPHPEKPSKVNKISNLFWFQDIAVRLEDCVNQWVDAYSEIEPSVNLYFSTKHGGHKYLEPKFLALAQAVETLHRRTSTLTLMDTEDFQKLVGSIVASCPTEYQAWLEGRLANGNELPLRKRLAAVAKPYAELFGGSKLVRKFVSRATDTRNYLTHYNKELKSKAARGAKLVPLIMQLEVLLELRLLQRIGFSFDEIATIARSGSGLSQKLKYIRKADQ